jgi:hypothetical protein
MAHLWWAVPWEVHAPNVRHVRPSPTISDCPQLSWPTFGVMCSWVVHAPNVRHVRPSPTILDCPQLSWPTLVCKCVPWEVHIPNVRHVRPPTILDCPQLSSTFGVNVSLDGTCTECETCETTPTILDCPHHPGPPLV